MKIFCIADNMDFEIGMKLAGADGITLEKPSDISAKIDEILANKEIGILAVTEGIYHIAKDKIDYIRLNKKLPLITII